MKRVKAACIQQTLHFFQKELPGMGPAQMLEINRQELQRYLQGLKQTSTRHQVVSREEQEDGSIVLRIRKQYNDKAEVDEYFL